MSGSKIADRWSEYKTKGQLCRRSCWWGSCDWALRGTFGVHERCQAIENEITTRFGPFTVSPSAFTSRGTDCTIRSFSSFMLKTGERLDLRAPEQWIWQMDRRIGPMAVRSSFSALLSRVWSMRAGRWGAGSPAPRDVAEASGSRTHLRHYVPHAGFEARAQHRPRVASMAILTESLRANLAER